MAHHKKKFKPPKQPIKTTFDENVIYEVVIWDGIKEKVAQFMYESRAKSYFQKIIDECKTAHVFLRKIEKFKNGIVNSIMKGWEVNGAGCKKDENHLYQGSLKMNYMVDGGKGKRPVFSSLEEANAFANEVLKETGNVFSVFETLRKATHTYNLEVA